MVGAGAIGAPLAAWLVEGGHAVSVYARGATADAIEREGITWSAADAANVRKTERVDVVRSLRSGDRPDLVVVTVKTPALDEVLSLVARTYGRELLVAGTQNGIDVLRILPAHFRRPVLALVHFNGTIEAPAHFVVQSRGPLVVAPLGAATTKDADTAASILGRATTIVRSDRARDAALCKMVLNLTGSLQALTAWSEVPPDDPAALQALLSSMLSEGVDVVRATGASEVVVPGAPRWLLLAGSAMLPGTLTRPIFMRNLRKMKLSRLSQDLARGVPLAETELEAIHGELVRLADVFGVRAKVMRLVLQELRSRFGDGPGTPIAVSALARLAASAR